MGLGELKVAFTQYIEERHKFTLKNISTGLVKLLTMHQY